MKRRIPARARGVALLIVLVVLVLIATLATEIAITARTGYRMADHSMEDLLLRTAVDGRVAILKAALRYDGTNGSGYDGEADEWSWHKHEKLSGWGERGTSSFGQVTGDEALEAAQFKNTDVTIIAWCEDERSKVNLRGLMKPDDSPVFAFTRDALIRVIDLYREKTSDLDLSDGDAQEMVDDLVKWLRAESDTEDNPMPAVKPNRGRLQSVDDLLRVPGGHWTPERLYDVKDPDVADEEDQGSTASADASATDASAWERSNGLGGLVRYLTVFAEDAADPPMRININTAPAVVLKSLFDANDEDLADKMIEKRREGADEDPADAASGTSSGADASKANQGFFKTKQDITKREIDGMGDDLAKFPRLNFFADVASSVYSIRVIATIERAASGGGSGDDEKAPKEVRAACDYRQVVQRTNAGFLTLFTERRSDPLFRQ